MLRELSQLQGVPHAKNLPADAKRWFMCLHQKAAGWGGAERTSDHAQGGMVYCVQRPLSGHRRAIINERRKVQL